jgi:hypothetical protein
MLAKMAENSKSGPKLTEADLINIFKRGDLLLSQYQEIVKAAGFRLTSKWDIEKQCFSLESVQ